MRVLLSTYGGRGNVEPLVGPAVRLRLIDVVSRERPGSAAPAREPMA